MMCVQQSLLQRLCSSLMSRLHVCKALWCSGEDSRSIFWHFWLHLTTDCGVKISISDEPHICFLALVYDSPTSRLNTLLFHHFQPQLCQMCAIGWCRRVTFDFGAPQTNSVWLCSCSILTHKQRSQQELLVWLLFLSGWRTEALRQLSGRS